jgi:hypothetical protein
MSFEIGMVLAHLTDRVFVPYGFGVPWHPEANGETDRGPTIADLFDVPVPFRRDRLFDNHVHEPRALRCDWMPLYKSVLAFPDLGLADEHDLCAFSNGRQYYYTFGPEHAAATDLHLNTETLAAVAYFFSSKKDSGARSPSSSLASDRALSIVTYQPRSRPDSAHSTRSISGVATSSRRHTLRELRRLLAPRLFATWPRT